jgi:hypothetical protein
MSFVGVQTAGIPVAHEQHCLLIEPRWTAPGAFSVRRIPLACRFLPVSVEAGFTPLPE